MDNLQFSSGKTKVLLADDEKDIVDLVKVSLLKEDYEVITAEDGQEALDKIRAEDPDIILLDLTMPRKGGFDVLKDKSAQTLRGLYDKFKDFDFSNDEMIKNIRATYNAKKSKSKTAKENKLLIEELESQGDFLDRFNDIIKTQKFKMHKPVKLKKRKKIKRAIFAKLSDLHIQAQIDGEEMGGLNQFGNIEEARRLAFYLREVCEYKKDKRDETELVLALNGDLGQGVIHDQESTPLMTTQFSAMLSLLLQSITYAASHYGKVTVVCTGGNHLRFMHKSNKGRVSAQKWDSFSTMLYISLRAALKNHKNITFDIPVTPYALIEVLGHKYFITHSDTVISVGNVGKTVSTDNIKNKVNDLISGLGNIDAVLLGHVHVPLHTTLNNNTSLVINGSMSGIDPFCQSIGILTNNPCQVMFEATEEYAVGDVRFVKLLQADSMEELDNIITPFEGKF